MKSLSNLINGGGDPKVVVRRFDAEEFEPPCPSRHSVRTGGRVLLPVGGNPTPGTRTPRRENLGDAQSHLEKEAYEKGFEQGHKDGMALAEKRMEQARRESAALLEGLSRLKNQIYAETEQTLVTLSLAVARKILVKEIRTDPSVVTRSLEACFSLLNNASRVRVLIHPEDLREVQRDLAGMASSRGIDHVDLVEDPCVERGGCVLDTGFGRINGTIGARVAAVEREIEEELRSHFEE